MANTTTAQVVSEGLGEVEVGVEAAASQGHRHAGIISQTVVDPRKRKRPARGRVSEARTAGPTARRVVHEEVVIVDLEVDLEVHLQGALD